MIGRGWLVGTALVAISCSSSAPTLELLITAPSPAAGTAGSPPGTLDVRIYDDSGLLREQKFDHPTLPGGVQLTALPTHKARLRIIVATLGSDGSIQWLAGDSVPLPLEAARLNLALSDSLTDGDGDGVPDVLDDCPTVADPDQKSTVGFGQGPGAACATQGPPAPDDMATPPPQQQASLCAGSQVLLCDGLSSPNSDEEPLDNAAFDTSQSFRGGSSLHLSAPIKGDLIFGIQIPVPDVYLRAFVYLPSPMPSNTFTFLRIQQDQSPFYSLDLQVSEGKTQLNNTRTLTAWTSTTGPPLDRWFCVQWHVHIDTQGYVDVVVDGKEQVGLTPSTTMDTTNSPGYFWTVLALEPYDQVGPQLATNLWIDEIAVDSKPISCTQ